MKKLRCILCVILVIIISLYSIACGPTVEYWDDFWRVNLRVQVYDAGYGNDWLNDCVEDFEEKYKDTSFGDLKGVDIYITTDRTLGSAIKSSYSYLQNDIYFFPGVDDYYGLAKEGYLLDLTDIFTEVPAENKGAGKSNKSIKDNLFEDVEQFLSIKDNNGVKHYYGIPCNCCEYGFYYDVDMFFNYGLYYKDNHTQSATSNNFITPIDYDAQEVIDKGGEYVKLVDGKYVTILGDTLSTGPDGIYGTSDDGEPEHYSDFYNLCEYMKKAYNINPYISYYEPWGMVNAMAVDYMGADEAKALRDFSGKMKYISSWDNANNPKSFDTYDLSQANADKAMVYKSAGYYYGKSFVSKAHIYPNTGNTHLGAMLDFMLSSKRIKNNNKRYAFLYESGGWEMEAIRNGLFDTVLKTTNDEYFNYENRKIKALSLPKADGMSLGSRTVTIDNSCLAIIPKKVEDDPVVERVAKLFLQFLYSDEGNLTYLKNTALNRCMYYPVYKDELTYIENQVYNSYNDSNKICQIAKKENGGESLFKNKNWFDNIG